MNFATYFDDLKKKHIVLVAFGDSITENNHWVQGQQNWVQLLESNLYNIFPKRATVINSGLSGDSLPECMDRLERDVLRFQPDIVIVSFGANDVLKDQPEEFRKLYRILLKKLLDSGAKVVTRTPTPYISMENGKPVTTWNGKHLNFAAYACAIREVSEELEVMCIDHFSMWMKSLESKYAGEMMMLMGNFIHPNGNGHRRMYYEMAPYFGLPPFHQNEFEHILWCEGEYHL